MIIILIAYSVIMIMIGLFSKKKAFNTVEGGQHWIGGSLSVSATWVWAPALFVSIEQGSKNGLSGIFWFVIPNILALLFFGMVSSKTIKTTGGAILPIIRDKYGEKSFKAYVFVFLTLQALSASVQLLAGGAFINVLTGCNAFLIKIIMLIVVFIYTIRGGIKSSVLTDAVQALIMIAAAWVVLFVNPNFNNVEIDFGNFIRVMTTSGIATAIGLVSGPIGDQMFWQRAKIAKRGEVKKTYIFSAVWFALIVIPLSIKGMMIGKAGGSGEQSLAMLAMSSGWVVRVLIVLMIISGLCSTLDSILCAVVDIVEEEIKIISKHIVLQRWIIFLIIGGISLLISSIKGITVFWLFMFYGMVRSSTFFITLKTIYNRGAISAKLIPVGVFSGVGIGALIYFIGGVFNVGWLTGAGTVLSCIIPYYIAGGKNEN